MKAVTNLEELKEALYSAFNSARAKSDRYASNSSSEYQTVVGEFYKAGAQIALAIVEVEKQLAENSNRKPSVGISKSSSQG